MAERAIAKPETGNSARIRGPNLRVLVKKANGVPFQRALELADKENLALASNRRMAKALIETDEWTSIREAFQCWTGTMAGYSKPRAKLGEFIEYSHPYTGQKYVFPVPEQFRGEKDAVLIAEHPDYVLVPDGKILVVSASKVDLISQFPKYTGWYGVDKEHNIPCGEGLDPKSPFSSSIIGHLWRAENRVGLVSRDGIGQKGVAGTRYDVFLEDGPYDDFGVVVESPV